MSEEQDLDRVRRALAPSGVLRAGINLSNFLLVTDKLEDGQPVGVAPDLAAEIARRLEVELRYVTYRSPGELADDALNDAWDIGLMGAEPARAEHIHFTNPYVEIEATYLVPPGSSLHRIEEVDQPGIRISVPARAAFELWLTDNIKHATMHRVPGRQAYEDFVSEGLDALAGLRAGLVNDVEKLPGARILDGKFTSVKQALGVRRGNDVASAFLEAFVAGAKSGGLVQRLIDRHGVTGRLTVAG